MNNKLYEKYIKLNRAGKTICPPDWHWDTEDFIKDYDIWTAVKGLGMLTTRDKSYTISPGDCFVLRRNERYFFEQNPEHPFVVYYIHYDYIEGSGKSTVPDDSSLPAFYRKIDNLAFFTELTERVVSAYKHGDNCQKAELWLSSILLEIGTYDSKPVFSGFEMDQYNLVEKICSQITEDPASFVSLSQLAKMHSYTPDHLCRLFKKYKGITPSQFILTAKLELAGALLKASNYSISRISELLGYRDVYFFSKQFHQKTGLTPSEYRKRVY